VYRRRLGIALDVEPASTESRPHMMHHDQNSSAIASPVQKRTVDGYHFDDVSVFNGLSKDHRLPEPHIGLGCAKERAACGEGCVLTGTELRALRRLQREQRPGPLAKITPGIPPPTIGPGTSATSSRNSASRTFDPIHVIPPSRRCGYDPVLAMIIPRRSSNVGTRK
jgi:hypothetical protein